MTRLLVLLVLLAPALAKAQTTVAGSTPGSFRVTEGGAAEYRIPIRVTPGIAGMEPSLALSYNSQAGNGLLGMGWDLAGLSEITRCPRTMAQDGVRGGVNYDSNDRYCLDGQRLMAISGTYGADGTEYRAERESFTKVISYGAAGSGPAWFKAWTKSGQVMEYGNSADSRIEAQSKATVRVWAVNKVSDTKGNYLTVSYTEDNANGDYRPNRVDYGGSASVRFEYETRPDQTALYQAGSMIKATHRLRKVRAFLDSTSVRDYELAYAVSPATQRSRLDSLVECGDGSCFPATTFTWQTASGSFTAVGNIAGRDPVFASPDWQWHPGDFNGDGKADLLISAHVGYSAYRALWLSQPDDSFVEIQNLAGLDGAYPSASWQRLVGDFNGDGKADILFSLSDGTSGQRALWLGQGDGTFTVINNLNAMDGSYASSRWKTQLADFNGDGKTDILFRYNENGVTTYRVLWLSNGDGSFAVVTNPAGKDGIYTSDDWQWHLADFNGDGRADFLVSAAVGYSAYRALWLSQPDGSYTEVPNLNGMDGAYADTRWMRKVEDFNGDGLADILFHYVDNVAAANRVLWLSRGDGTFEVVTNVAGLDNWLCADSWQWIFGDFNGDGKADALVSASVGYSAYRVLWSSVPGNNFLVTNNVAGLDGMYTSPDWNRQLADFNGDGAPDILFEVANGVGGYRVIWYSQSGAQDVIATVTNGLGLATTVTYDRLTKGAPFYTKDANASYPVLDSQPAAYVVSEILIGNGAGATHRTTYRYAGAKVDQQGRGSLGFREITAKDEQTEIKQITTFRQDWPYLGLPSLVRRTQSSGALLSQATNTYGCTNPSTGSACTVIAGNRYFPFASQSVETGNDLNGASLPSVTTTTSYDTFGNATSVAVSTGDGYSKTTTNTFANDVANWFLGRLTRSSVQSVTP
jgi:hypothetical protein